MTSLYLRVGRASGGRAPGAFLVPREAQRMEDRDVSVPLGVGDGEREERVPA